MAPERAARGAHGGHVAAKNQKLAKDMAHMEKQEDQIAIKKGIHDLAETIRNDPNAARKLRRAQDAIKIEDHAMEDKNRFASDLEGRQLKRAPTAFLKNGRSGFPP
ncbi:unnamed protein product [Prorocentrum cordatum]|uniref:Uncharacterized protein n=1 Tax=Prorocentrum cordatum TaxID=2364126 RepID=A0ABN9XYE1_9DINO|nr:unnamed protein product [Polarella glacialis]